MKKGQCHMLFSCILSFLIVWSLGAGDAWAQSRRRRSPQTPPQPISPLQGGFGASLIIPFEETNEILDLSASVHGTLLYHTDRAMDFEADIGYWFLQAINDGKDANKDTSLLTLTGGIRYYLTPSIHIDAGLGLHRFARWDLTINGVTTSYDAQNKLGFYEGVGFELVPVDVTVRLHHSDFYIEDFWNIGIGVRVFFPSSGSRRP